MGASAVQQAHEAWPGKTVQLQSRRQQLVWGIDRHGRWLGLEYESRRMQAYLWPPSTGLPGLRGASRPLAVVLIFSCRPGLEAAAFRALRELFVVAAVDMEGRARGRAPLGGSGIVVVGAGAIGGGWKGRPAQR